MESVDPRFNRPKTEAVEPDRMKLRMLKEDPNNSVSRIDKQLPISMRPKREVADPSRA